MEEGQMNTLDDLAAEDRRSQIERHHPGRLILTELAVQSPDVSPLPYSLPSRTTALTTGREEGAGPEDAKYGQNMPRGMRC